MPHHKLLDTLAEVIHEKWRQTIQQTGAPNPSDVPFSTLNPELQNSNRAAARRITEVLAVAGLDADEGLASPEEEAAVRAHIELHLESFATAEHDGWMVEKKHNGWRYGAVRDNDLKLHNCLLPFDQLGHDDQEKNRVQVREYPDWARLAGWRLVFVDEMKDEDI